MKIIEYRKRYGQLPFIEITSDILNTANEYFQYATTLGNALGLAAPQIGLDLRMCAVKTSKCWVCAINPEILESKYNKFLTKEGCLTWPNFYVIAERHSTVLIKFYDLLSNEIKTQWFNGIDAIIWQHEIDHLLGIEEKLIKRNQKITKDSTKIGRNDSCACGSDLKFKKCCQSIYNTIDVLPRDIPLEAYSEYFTNAETLG